MSQASAIPVDFPQMMPLEAAQDQVQVKASIRPPANQSNFYARYDWSLNPFPTVRQVAEYLDQQLERLQPSEPTWQGEEIYRNVYLLGCAILDSTDDFLLGPKYEFAKISASVPLSTGAVKIAERACRRAGQLSQSKLRRLTAWRQQWQLSLIVLLKSFVTSGPPDHAATMNARRILKELATSGFFEKLLRKHIRIPGAFRSQDLTHFDFLALGRKFVEQYPDREKPVTVFGLRTAGSYFAPLLHAYLETENYSRVESVTVRPKHGISKREAEILAAASAKQGLVLMVDEPVGTGSTFMKAVQLLRQFSVPLHRMMILTPLHSGFSHLWKNSSSYALLSRITALTLAPEQWHKIAHLDRLTHNLMEEYFTARGSSVTSIDACSPRAEAFNQYLERVSDKKGHTRIKRVYEVRTVDRSGSQATTYVMAKGVGWGWFSYHAFLAGERLAEFTVPILGLRDGVLYTEWQPQRPRTFQQRDRQEQIERAASYIATRAQKLPLVANPATALILEHRNNGLANLANYLCRAYGPRPASFLSRGRIVDELSRLACPMPSFIDGQMRPCEWACGADLPLKTDFEHHGLGRTEINMTDPAFDLADTILTWQLSSDEEKLLLRRYREVSGDNNIADRLLISKLVAGIRARDTAMANLGDSRLLSRHEEFNRDYIEASNFLVLHTMRYCAELCGRPKHFRWHAPLVALDVDGVLDKQVIGFPSATWAGVQAIEMLHRHDFSVVLNTARSIEEVKQYARHYGFLGGVAEYGAYVWDAISGREKVLVTEESIKQLRTLAEELRRIPGIFLNDDYLYSMRAYTYDGETTKPIPGLLIQNLLSKLRLDRLHFHQTYTDTAVLAHETDKGKGLLALLDLVGHGDLLGAAVGDSEADLPMFAVATSSFSPGHISCRAQASAVGCYIDRKPFQPGLLNIVRRMVHSGKGSCKRCAPLQMPERLRNNLVFQVLQHADESRLKRLARSMLHPTVIKSFLAN